MCHRCGKSSICDTWDDSSSDSSIQSLNIQRPLRKPYVAASPTNKMLPMGKHNIIESKLLRKIAELQQEILRRDMRIRELEQKIGKLEGKVEVSRQLYLKQTQDVKKSMTKIIEKIKQDKNQQSLHNVDLRIQKMLRSVEKQAKENGKITEKIEKEVSKLEKPNEQWRDNFITVFLDLMMRVAMKEGVHIKLDGCRKKEVKRAWRLLKIVIGRYYVKQPNCQPV